jgi:hypothetical protein
VGEKACRVSSKSDDNGGIVIVEMLFLKKCTNRAKCATSRGAFPIDNIM